MFYNLYSTGPVEYSLDGYAVDGGLGSLHLDRQVRRSALPKRKLSTAYKIPVGV